MSMCDANFEAALEQKLMGGIARKFPFCFILIETRDDQILVPIAQEVPKLSEIFDFFNTLV